MPNKDKNAETKSCECIKENNKICLIFIYSFHWGMPIVFPISFKIFSLFLRMSYMYTMKYIYIIPPMSSFQFPISPAIVPHPISCLLFLNKTLLHLVSASHVCMGLGPSCRAWESYQRLHPQRTVILPPPATILCQKLLSEGQSLNIICPPMLDFYLAWSYSGNRRCGVHEYDRHTMPTYLVQIKPPSSCFQGKHLTAFLPVLSHNNVPAESGESSEVT